MNAGVTVLVVPAGFPNSHYESAALTAELRARSPQCTSESSKSARLRPKKLAEWFSVKTDPMASFFAARKATSAGYASSMRRDDRYQQAMLAAGFVFVSRSGDL